MLWSVKVTVVVRLTFNGFLFLSVTQRLGIRVTGVTNSIPWTAVFPPKYVICYRSRRVRRLHQVPCVLIFSDIWRKRDPDLFRRRRETLLLPLMVGRKENLSKEVGGMHDFRRSLKQQHARRTQSSGTWNRHAFLRRDQQGITTMAQRNRRNVSTSNNASLRFVLFHFLLSGLYNPQINRGLCNTVLVKTTIPCMASLIFVSYLPSCLSLRLKTISLIKILSWSGITVNNSWCSLKRLSGCDDIPWGWMWGLYFKVSPVTYVWLTITGGYREALPG